MKVNAALFLKQSSVWVEQLSSLWRMLVFRSPSLPLPRRVVIPLSMRMDRDEIVRLDKQHHGQEIQVRDGTIWLTGVETGDVILERGQTFTLRNQSPFVIQALTEATWTLRC
jgi:hypothetical protein